MAINSGKNQDDIFCFKKRCIRQIDGLKTFIYNDIV